MTVLLSGKTTSHQLYEKLNLIFEPLKSLNYIYVCLDRMAMSRHGVAWLSTA